MPYRGKLLIGLTGNIACGKSTVLRRLAELGAYTIDADSRIHRILKKDGPAYRPVVAEFGPGILAEDGEIDRQALGRIVFADPECLKRLEQIEHPIVREIIEAEIAAAPAEIVVLDAIKLFESGWAEKCDSVWVVTCTREQQVERLMRTRGYSRADAETRISAQGPQDDKVRRATVVIDNSGPLDDTYEQVDRAWARAGTLGPETQGSEPAPASRRESELKPWGVLLAWLVAAARALRERPFWLAMLFGVVAMSMAYQSNRALYLDIGGPFDGPETPGFHAPEQSGDATFRWAGAAATLYFRGLGRPSSDFPIQLQLSSGRGAQSAPLEVGVAVNGRPLPPLELTGESRSYTLIAHPDDVDSAGNLKLSFVSPTFQSGADSRDLGFIADFARVELPPGPVLPAIPQLAWLLLAGALLYVAMRAIWLRPWASALLVVVVFGAFAAVLALQRLLLTVFSERLAVVIAAAIFVALAVEVLTRLLVGAAGWTGDRRLPEWSWTWLRALVFVSAALKIGGVLYPHTVIIDAYFHLKQITYMSEGRPWEQFFGKNLALSVMPKEEWGNARAFIPYSPFFYVVAAPLARLPLALSLSVPFVMAALDAARVALVFLLGLTLGRPAGAARRAVASAAIFAAIPATFLLQQWGNWPTQASLWLVTLWAGLVCLFWQRLARPSVWLVTTVVLALTLLSYTVTAAYTGMFVLLLVVLGLLFARAERARWLAILASLVAATVAAVAIFYGQYIPVILSETLPTFGQAVEEQGKLTTLRPNFGAFLTDTLGRAMQSYSLAVVYALGLAGALLFFVVARRANRTGGDARASHVATSSRSESAQTARWQGVWLGTWLLVFPLVTLADFWVDQALKEFWYPLPAIAVVAAVWLLALSGTGAASVRARLAWLLWGTLAWQSLSLWVYRLLFHNR